MEQLQAFLLNLGVGGAAIAWLLWDRQSLKQEIKDLRAEREAERKEAAKLLKDSQDARLGDLREMQKETTRTIGEVIQVVRGVSEGQKVSADNTSKLGEAVKSLEHMLERAIERWPTGQSK